MLPLFPFLTECLRYFSIWLNHVYLIFVSSKNSFVAKQYNLRLRHFWLECLLLSTAFVRLIWEVRSRVSSVGPLSGFYRPFKLAYISTSISKLSTVTHYFTSARRLCFHLRLSFARIKKKSIVPFFM